MTAPSVVVPGGIQFLRSPVSVDMARVEILATPDCPYRRAAVARVAMAAQLLDIRPEIQLILINGLDDARAHQFFGSPTIRVDGIDIDVAPRAQPESLRCRLYDTTHGLDWVPDVKPICAALAQRAILS